MSIKRDLLTPDQVDQVIDMSEECMTPEQIFMELCRKYPDQKISIAEVTLCRRRYLHRRLGCDNLMGYKYRLQAFQLFEGGFDEFEVSNILNVKIQLVDQWHALWQKLYDDQQLEQETLRKQKANTAAAGLSFPGGAVFGGNTKRDTIWRED